MWLCVIALISSCDSRSAVSLLAIVTEESEPLNIGLFGADVKDGLKVCIDE